VSDQNALPSASSEYRGRRRAQPTLDEQPQPLTRRQLLELRRAAERAVLDVDQPAPPDELDLRDRDERNDRDQRDQKNQDDDDRDRGPNQPPGPPAEREPDPFPQPRSAAHTFPAPQALHSTSWTIDEPAAEAIGPQQLGITGPPLLTRRQLAEQRRARPERKSHGPRKTHGPRKAAVVLGAATVTVVAVTAGRAFGVPPTQLSAAAELPNAVAATQQLSPKVTSSSVIKALRIGASSTIPLGVRASRSSDRPVLPGCSGRVTDYSYPNGEVPQRELCALTFAPGHHLRADAAVALARLNIAYRARFGHDLCLTDSYRSVAAQESLAARKPGLAARPGTSEHGMGLAVDFCDGVEKYSSTEYDWMRANAPAFGWENPAWAIPPSAREEPWHWEYVVGEARTT
jgi:hypothetical protein